MSLAPYDLRKRAGPRRRPGLSSRWRRWSPREIALAGWIAYAVVVAVCFFVVDQKAATRRLSAWLDSPPKVERCDSSVRAVERPRARCVRW